MIPIALQSILEHSRRKLILFFGIFSLLITGVLIYLTKNSSAEVVFGPRGEIATFAALGSLQFLALIAALAVSMGTIGQPFANGEAALTLARPVTRWQFAIGRYLGSATVIVGMCLLLAIETQVVELIGAGDISSTIWGHWGTTTFNLLVVAAMTSLASVFFSAPVLAAVVGFFANEAVQVGRALYTFAKGGLVKGSLATLFRLAWYITPKFLPSPLERSQASSAAGNTNIGDLVLSISPGLVVWAVAWLLGLIALSLVLTGRKEV
jgi:ABC-type transport system involved in multi-copper enzyme maturation permease subunit